MHVDRAVLVLIGASDPHPVRLAALAFHSNTDSFAFSFGHGPLAFVDRFAHILIATLALKEQLERTLKERLEVTACLTPYFSSTLSDWLLIVKLFLKTNLDGGEKIEFG